VSLSKFETSLSNVNSVTGQSFMKGVTAASAIYRFLNVFNEHTLSPADICPLSVVFTSWLVLVC
jgi:hypothetical protein